MPSCVIRFFHQTGKKVTSAPVTDLDHTNRKMSVKRAEDTGCQMRYVYVLTRVQHDISSVICNS